MSIDDQLKSGLRYFGFPLQRIFWKLVPLSRASSTRIRIKRLARMYAWLERVQNEVIMLQIKMEGGIGDKNALEEMLRSELTKNVRFWALGNRVQRLGAVRGKI